MSEAEESYKIGIKVEAATEMTESKENHGNEMSEAEESYEIIKVEAAKEMTEIKKNHRKRRLSLR